MYITKFVHPACSTIIMQLFISRTEIKPLHATRLTVSFVSLLMHECTSCALNENYVLKITLICRKLNNLVTISVSSRDDQKFSQAHIAHRNRVRCLKLHSLFKQNRGLSLLDRFDIRIESA